MKLAPKKCSMTHKIVSSIKQAIHKMEVKFSSYCKRKSELDDNQDHKKN